MGEKTIYNSICYHCGEPCDKDVVAAGDKQFCCAGCRSVFEILHQNNLDNYYCLNEFPGAGQKNTGTQKFDFLSDPAIATKLLSFQHKEISRVTFYLPQIHCSSCLWLLENLRKANSAIINSQVNFSAKEVTISFNHQGITLKELVQLLSSIGYEPHISLNDFQKDKNNSTSKQNAYKLGIAGFCFANIMLLSFPEYVGLSIENDALLTKVFRWLNLALALPVFFYCANEFFVNALYSFRQKYLNIDSPVALAILVTFSRSIYEVVSGTGSGYFDSMSGIVFFMLIGRVVQNRVHTTLQFNRDFKSYFPIAVTVKQEANEAVKMVQDIAENDVVLLQHNEIVPVDSFFSRGKAQFDYSFITGESTPLNIEKGEIVYAGARVMNGAVEMLAIKPFSQNSFTQLWNNPIFSKEKNDKQAGYTKLSKYFSIIVFIIAAAAFIYWFPKQPNTAWNALTAVLIVACPCALLLTASFTYGYIIEKFATKGFFVKNGVVVDELSKINTIVFDKTGTITEINSLIAHPQLIKWTVEGRNIALSIMAKSTHPLSKAIIKQQNRFDVIPIENFREVEGQGVEAWINDQHFKCGNSQFATGQPSAIDTTGSELYITADGKLLAYFVIQSSIRKGAEEMFSALKGYNTFLLSGDNESSRTQMQHLFPKDATLIYNQQPEQKLEFIANLQKEGNKVLMMGDGLNDAGALKQSQVGVAVLENNFSFTPGCDAILEAGNVALLPNYLQTAKKSQLLIRVGLAYSILYNIVGIYFAVTGEMQPMIAAILMPLSSLGVILITYLGTKIIFDKY